MSDGRSAGRATVWQPGQSGNPRGGSEKQRRQRQIREWIADIAEQEIPENLLNMMRGGYFERILDATTRAAGKGG